MELSNDYWKDDLSGISYGSKSLILIVYYLGLPEIFNEEFKYNAQKHKDLINFEKRELRRQNQEIETIDDKIERILDRIRSSMKEKYNIVQSKFKKGVKKAINIERGFHVQPFMLNDNQYYQVNLNQLSSHSHFQRIF